MEIFLPIFMEPLHLHYLGLLQRWVLWFRLRIVWLLAILRDGCLFNAFSRSTLLLNGTLDNPFLSSVTYSGLVPYYSFHLTRRHYGNTNLAFLDGHVEHGSLRDWRLPVESVHRRWYWDGKAHLDRLVYGVDEEISND